MRVLHTMIRVGDLDRSIRFYTDVLGMKLLRRQDYPDGKFTLAFVGYGPESEHAVIELTYNYGVEKYDSGPRSAISLSKSRTPTRRAMRSKNAVAGSSGRPGR